MDEKQITQAIIDREPLRHLFELLTERDDVIINALCTLFERGDQDGTH